MALSFGFSTSALTQYGNSVTTTGGTTQAAGSTFVAFTAGTTATSVTDNKGNTYTLKASGNYNSTNQQMTVWECENGVGGSGHTVTANYSATTSNAIAFVEVLGGATFDAISSVLDTAIPSISTASADAVLSFTAGPNYTTYTAVSDTFSNVLTSNLAGGTNGIEFALGGTIQSSAGSVSDTFTFTPALTPFGQVIVGFKQKPILAFTQYGPYNNTGGAGTQAQASGTISYAAGQPIIVEGGATVALSISDTAALSWNVLLSTSASGDFQYVWYAIPASSGSTIITLTQASGTAYFSFRVVAYTANAGTPGNATTTYLGATGAATPFSTTITPTSSGSAVWMYLHSGYGPNAPTPGSGCSLYASFVAAGNRSDFTIGTTAEPLTSNSATTLSGTTTADFQTTSLITYEVPLAASGGSGSISVAFFKF